MNDGNDPSGAAISRNLRHLRVFLEVADSGSVTLAARRRHVSQPAATQAVAKMEGSAGGRLFDRTRQGFFLTPRGTALAHRVRRALSMLDPALAEVSPRLPLTATSAQLSALIAVREAENFALAARQLGLAQPTVHRAVTQLEREAGRDLFERTSHGIVATRAARALAGAARLAFAELDQAEADLAEMDGGASGPIRIGALPLSRSVVLPGALAAFAADRPNQEVVVVDAPYDDLLGALRTGRIDVMIGALRDPLPVPDVAQERLFGDRVCVLCGPAHPLASAPPPRPEALRDWPWAAPLPGSPSRARFDEFFADAPPAGVIGTGSILMMRELLIRGNRLGWISAAQAEAEVSKGLLVRLDVALAEEERPIGLTTRTGWAPTAPQVALLERIREQAAGMQVEG